MSGIRCFICSSSFGTFTSYRTHLRFKHAVHYSGVEVPCGQEFCPRKFTSFAALLHHFQKCHTHLLQTNETACRYGENEQASSSSNLDNENAGHSSNSEPQDCVPEPSFLTAADPVNITGACMKFLGSLQAKSNMTQANIQTISENLQVLLSDVAEFSQSHVKQLCQEVGINYTNPCVAKCLNNLSELNKAVEPISSTYRRVQYLTNSGFFIRPVQIVLGSRTETRFSAKVGFRRNVVVEDTMQYVPLSELLAAILCNEYYVTLVKNFSRDCSVAIQKSFHTTFTLEISKISFFANIPVHKHYIFTLMPSKSQIL